MIIATIITVTITITATDISIVHQARAVVAARGAHHAGAPRPAPPCPAPHRLVRLYDGNTTNHNASMFLFDMLFVLFTFIDKR